MMAEPHRETETSGQTNSPRSLEHQPGTPITDLSRAWEIDAFGPARYPGSIFYMQPSPVFTNEKPYFLNFPVDERWSHKLKQTNIAYTRKIIAVTDIRGHEKVFSLNKQGFELGHFETALEYDDFASDEKIVGSYYEEVKTFLKSYTGAQDVIPFEFQVRRNDSSLPANARGSPGKAQPLGSVHADQTGKAAIRRLKYFHPAMAQKYANGGRVQIINVWKPLRGPVQNAPLAVCDYRTVDRADEMPTDIIFPDYLGETYNFLPQARHRFYYVDEQEACEAWMIKCFDSATASDDSIAEYCPHVSFPYVSRNNHAKPRESVEVRAFALHL